MAAARTLLDWYLRHRRPLPWRDNQDPYRVWVSEIMLQQTRVETAIPYFERFVSRFPTVEALAAAETDELLANWSGLGYYRRARLMHRAAQRIAAEGFPRSLDGLRELPGIGEYTAAAIASIAFGVHAPVLDGNVERVLCRRLAIAGDPKAPAVRRALREAARDLLVLDQAGDSNQALMELGATICLPLKPSCHRCPLSAGCRARAEGTVDRFPRPRLRRPLERVRLAVAVVSEGQQTLMFRRAETSELLPGTWELPWVKLEEAETRATIEKGLAARYGGMWKVGGLMRRVRHSITHRAIEAEIYSAQLGDSGYVAEGPEAGWFSPEERAEIPTSSLVAKALEPTLRRVDRRRNRPTA